jgi:hypothetical protein
VADEASMVGQGSVAGRFEEDVMLGTTTAFGSTTKDRY